MLPDVRLINVRFCPVNDSKLGYLGVVTGSLKYTSGELMCTNCCLMLSAKLGFIRGG